MIPKLIHQIWLGPPMPRAYRQYRDKLGRLNPSWDLLLWDEERLKSLRLLNQDLYDQLVRERVPASQLSDVLRFDLLCQFGGLYLDADFEMLKPLDLLQERGIGIWGSSEIDHLGNQVFNGAFLGARPEHPLIREFVQGAPQRIRAFGVGGNLAASLGPRYVDERMRAYQSRSPRDLKLIPTELLYPYGYWQPEKRFEAFPEAIGVHRWGASWKERRYPLLGRINDVRKACQWFVRGKSLNVARTVRRVLGPGRGKVLRELVLSVARETPVVSLFYELGRQLIYRPWSLAPLVRWDLCKWPSLLSSSAKPNTDRPGFALTWFSYVKDFEMLQISMAHARKEIGARPYKAFLFEDLKAPFSDEQLTKLKDLWDGDLFVARTTEPMKMFTIPCLVGEMRAFAKVASMVPANWLITKIDSDAIFFGDGVFEVASRSTADGIGHPINRMFNDNPLSAFQGGCYFFRARHIHRMLRKSAVVTCFAANWGHRGFRAAGISEDVFLYYLSKRAMGTEDVVLFHAPIIETSLAYDREDIEAFYPQVPREWCLHHFYFDKHRLFELYPTQRSTERCS